MSQTHYNVQHKRIIKTVLNVASKHTALEEFSFIFSRTKISVSNTQCTLQECMYCDLQPKHAGVIKTNCAISWRSKFWLRQLHGKCKISKCINSIHTHTHTQTHNKGCPVPHWPLFANKEEQEEKEAAAAQRRIM